MSEIANQLTLDGIANGTPLTSASPPALTVASGNVKGTGATWTVAGLSTGPTITTEGHGARIIATGAQLARFDAALATPASAVRVQARYTRGGAISAAHMPIVLARSGSSSRSQLMLGTDNNFYGQAPTGSFNMPSSAYATTGAVGDTMLLDCVFALNAAPSGANSRVFYRLKNLTNPTWDTDGEYFYDSLYTRDLGTTLFDVIRFGINAGAAASPGILFEYLGLEGITVNPAHTSKAQAEAYFADAPVETTPLPAVPNLALTMSRPTTPGGANGTVRATWDDVTGEDHYEARIAPGSGATSGWIQTDTNAVSPKTFVVPAPGPYTVQVRAIAGA